ncbi:MAG: holo-[acyl-carrier-protein] synthase [Calditrichaeota bacterium]|nr:MAG: holo-[acyl-carrier-protein] synthase [Calditrichota bacterium]
MSVYSVGMDVVEIRRIAELIERHGERFLKRVYTDREIEYCRRKVNAASFAARFAAKEAVLKAAGTGLNLGTRWRDVEVINDARGKPRVHLSGKTAELLGHRRVHISLSHTEELAVAMVVVEE